MLVSHLDEMSTSLGYMLMLPLVEQSSILLLEQILQSSQVLLFEENLELLILLYVFLSTHMHCVSTRIPFYFDRFCMFWKFKKLPCIVSLDCCNSSTIADF